MESQARQKMLLGVMLVGALAYGGYTYGYQPRREEVTQMEERLEALRLRNQTARLMSEQNGRGPVERQMQVYRAQLSRVEALIPSSEELPDLLDAISAEAQRSGVELSLIQPVGAVQESFYTRRTYDLAVLGSYHQVGSFLSEIASLPRIVTPTTLNLSMDQETGPAGEPRLQAKFSIETYVLPTASPTDTTNAP